MRRNLILLTFTLILIVNTFAHPHVFIDIGMDIESVSSAKISWTFDRIESENKIYYFDDNGDGALNEVEAFNLYEEGFKSVRDFNYFITVIANGEQYPVADISNFTTFIEDDKRLTVSFRIDLPESEDGNIFITHLDTSYFIAFADPVKEKIKVADGLYTKIFKDKEHPIYYDPEAARTVNLDTSEPQEGWLTAYPTLVIIDNKPIEGYDNRSSYSVKNMLIDIQRRLYKTLSDLLIDSENYIFIILIALFYGIVHALGPGHRKIVISSYILSVEKISYLKAIGISMISALIHSGSGIIIILLLNKLLIEKISNMIGFISYLSLFILSITLIIIKLLNRLKISAHYNYKPVALSLIILSSIVPCPGALTIMLFSLSMNIIPLGIVTVLSMSFGIGITLSIISLLTLKGKNSLKSNKERYTNLNTFIEWSGLIILFLFSLFFLLAQINL